MREQVSVLALLKKFSLVLLLAVFVIVSSILSKNFLKPTNLLNMLQQCSVPGVIAIGMTIVIIIGGIDLSVGGVAALCGMIASIIVGAGRPDAVGILAGIGVGALCGLFTGIIINLCIDPGEVKDLRSHHGTIHPVVGSGNRTSVRQIHPSWRIFIHIGDRQV